MSDAEDQSTGNSEIAASKPRSPGRPFVKGDPRINRSGRPKTAEFRQKNAAAYETFLSSMIALAQSGEAPFEQLRAALNDVARHAGYLTDVERVEIQAKQLRALADVLAGENLTEGQRTKIIEDFQTRATAMEVEDE